MDCSYDQMMQDWQMEAPIVRFEVELMGCKMVVFHLLSVDYTCILVSLHLVGADMAGYLLLAYFPAYLAQMMRNKCCFSDMDTVAAAD